MTWKERAKMKMMFAETGKMYLPSKKTQNENKKPPEKQNPQTKNPGIRNGEKLVTSCETIPRVFLRKSIAIKARRKLQMKRPLKAELTMTERLYSCIKSA